MIRCPRREALEPLALNHVMPAGMEPMKTGARKQQRGKGAIEHANPTSRARGREADDAFRSPAASSFLLVTNTIESISQEMRVEGTA